MTKALAVFVTFIAASMAAIAAWDRGGNTLDRALLVGISIVIVLAVHLLPALSKRSYVWLVWFACLLAAMYGHLTFLTHANVRAGVVRAETSPVTVGMERQIQAIQDALESIKARPLAIVTAELAVTNGRRQRAALREEVAEAKRAENLKEQLVTLYGNVTQAKVTGATDPVIVTLAEVTGYSEARITLVIGITLALLLELVGMLLWKEALRRAAKPEVKQVVKEPKSETKVAIITEPATDPVTELRQAVATGQCGVTVASIRKFFSCSQERAMELRRELVTLSS